MSGFKLGYTQSDEASFLLADWDNIETQPWFDNDQQKLSSLCASIMTANFNKIIHDRINSLWTSLWTEWAIVPTTQLIAREKKSEPPAFPKSLAVFDGRSFNLPMGPEIVNHFLWRAKDWERNSLSMVARSHFSAKQLHAKKKADMHEMLHTKGVNWAKDFDGMSRNGTFFFRNKEGNIVKEYPDPSYGTIAAIVSPLIGIDLTPKPMEESK
jgi:tRNA(His) 5'-end guanylyltransferase